MTWPHAAQMSHPRSSSCLICRRRRRRGAGLVRWEFEEGVGGEGRRKSEEIKAPGWREGLDEGRVRCIGVVPRASRTRDTPCRPPWPRADANLTPLAASRPRGVTRHHPRDHDHLKEARTRRKFSLRSKNGEEWPRLIPRAAHARTPHARTCGAHDPSGSTHPRVSTARRPSLPRSAHATDPPRRLSPSALTTTQTRKEAPPR